VKIQERYKVEIGHPERIDIVLVGCGGTGSFAALHLARLAYHLRETQSTEIKLTFVDDDVVEPKNLGRQNFCPPEVGEPKAWRLMSRYNAAFGLRTQAHVARFERGMVPDLKDGFHLIIGAVDNAAARQTLQKAVKKTKGRLWWLDGGNHESAGQVLIGNRADLETPEISPLKFCSGLPSPGTQHPELLEPPELELEAVKDESCAELALADVQSLMINQAIAGWLATYVSRLLVSRDLNTYATYLDLISGSTRSVFITEQVSKKKVA